MNSVATDKIEYTLNIRVNTCHLCEYSYKMNINVKQRSTSRGAIGDGIEATAVERQK